MNAKDTADVSRLADAIKKRGVQKPLVEFEPLLSDTGLVLQRCVSLLRKYPIEIAKEAGVPTITYEPGRYAKPNGKTPARVHLMPLAKTG